MFTCAKIRSYLLDRGLTSIKQNKKYFFTELGNNIWLGGTDSHQEGDWKWATSNSSISTVNWEASNSDNNEHCLEQHNERYWNDVGCHIRNIYMCEYEI